MQNSGRRSDERQWRPHPATRGATGAGRCRRRARSTLPAPVAAAPARKARPGHRHRQPRQHRYPTRQHRHRPAAARPAEPRRAHHRAQRVRQSACWQFAAPLLLSRQRRLLRQRRPRNRHRHRHQHRPQQRRRQRPPGQPTAAKAQPGAARTALATARSANARRRRPPPTSAPAPAPPPAPTARARAPAAAAAPQRDPQNHPTPAGVRQDRCEQSSFMPVASHPRQSGRCSCCSGSAAASTTLRQRHRSTTPPKPPGWGSHTPPGSAPSTKRSTGQCSFNLSPLSVASQLSTRTARTRPIVTLHPLEETQEPGLRTRGPL